LCAKDIILLIQQVETLLSQTDEANHKKLWERWLVQLFSSIIISPCSFFLPCL